MSMGHTHRKRRTAAVAVPTLAQAIAVAALGAGFQLELIEAQEPVYASPADVSVQAPSKQRLTANADRQHLEYMLPGPVSNVPLTGQRIRTDQGRLVPVVSYPSEPTQLSLAL